MVESFFHKSILVQDKNKLFHKIKKEEMPLKAVLSDLERNIVIVMQQWWATFKISFVVIFTRKTHESFLKG